MDNLRILPDGASVPVPTGGGGDDPAVIYTRFPLARLDTAPFVDPVRAGEAARAARAALYDEDDAAAIAPYIDRDYYLHTYPDIAVYSGDPVIHYHDAGWREGRRPNTWFDPSYYLLGNPDIAAAGIEPLLHYIRHGHAEGRLPARPGGELRDILDRASPPASRTPGYDAPLWAARLTEAELAHAIAAACPAARGLVLAVSHDRYIDIIGGVQIFIADEQALFNGDRYAYLHISPAVARATLDADSATPADMQVVLDGRLIGLADTETIEAVLRALPEDTAPLRLFIVHSLFGHRARWLATVSRAVRAQKSFFWLHDYATVCEGYNLMRDDMEFCHAPPSGSMSCRICVYGTRRDAYRAELRGLFDSVGFHVVAPSRAALTLWLAKAELPCRSARVHPNAGLDVLPDAATRAEDGPEDGRIRVAFVGFALAHKGWPLFLNLVEQLRALEVYRFYHFSAPDSLRPMDGLACVPVEVDRFDRFAAVAALAAHRIDFVLVLSPWPETFSYVMHEALAAGADVVALAGSGNVADVVRARRRGVVLRDGAALLPFFRDLHAVHYADARLAAGLHGGVLIPSGTTATLPPEEGAETGPFTTAEPDFVVIAGTGQVPPQRNGDVWTFTLPEGARTVRLVSRSFVPAARDQSARDRRRLGLPVGRLELDGVEIPAGDPRRLTGWHAPHAEAAPWQWTGGDATLDTGGATLLSITLARAPVAYPRVSFTKTD